MSGNAETAELPPAIDTDNPAEELIAFAYGKLRESNNPRPWLQTIALLIIGDRLRMVERAIGGPLNTGTLIDSVESISNQVHEAVQTIRRKG